MPGFLTLHLTKPNQKSHITEPVEKELNETETALGRGDLAGAKIGFSKLGGLLKGPVASKDAERLVGLLTFAQSMQLVAMSENEKNPKGRDWVKNLVGQLPRYNLKP